MIGYEYISYQTTPESWLFVGKNHNNYTYRISEDSMCSRYKYYYLNSYFPKLLQGETVSYRKCRG